MWGKILEQISRLVLIPLIKDLAFWVYEKFKELQKQKEKEKEITKTVERSVNEGDQRPIEDIAQGDSGEPSGRGVIVDSLPNVGLRDKKKSE